jgi:general secretion pathway protein G
MLAARRYLRSIPFDPVTDSAATWITIPPPDESPGGGVYDVRSGAPGNAADGTPYAQW